MKTSIRLALIGAFINAATAVVQFPFAKHANTGAKPASSTSRRAVNTGFFLGDLAYVVNASVGTPGQTVSLVLSSSTTDTWVLDTRSESCESYYDNDDDSSDTSETTSCIWGTFSSNLSSTYTPQPSNYSDDGSYYDYDFDVIYDDGAYAYGDYFNDTISLGGAIVSDFTMGLVNETSKYIGVLGIGYNDSKYSNLPDRLQEQGLINSTAYSIWLDDEQASSGNLLFGAIDTTKFDGSLARLSSYYSTSHVEMTIEIAGINGTTSDSNGPITITYDGTDDSSYYSSSSDSSDYLFPATFSPPDTLSTLPSDVASQIWDMAGAYYDSDLELAVISCTAADNTTTNFTIQLGKGIYGPIITTTMADLVIPAEDIRLSSLYQYYVNVDDNLCLFGVQNASANGYSSYSYSLGSSLLRRTYAVFDLVNGEIAVAPVKFGATATSNIVEFAAYGASVPSSTMHCIYSDCYETTSDGTDSDGGSGYADTLPAGVLSVPALIGMSLGIGLGALLLGIIGFCIWRHRLNKKEAGKEVPTASSAEAGEASPMMQPSTAAAGGAGAAPEMTQAAEPPAVVGGKGKAPEVPTPAALASVGEEPGSSAAAETSVAHDTGSVHDTNALHTSPAHDV